MKVKLLKTIFFIIIKLMQQLTPLMRKQKMKKQNKPKSTTIGQTSYHTACNHAVTGAKNQNAKDRPPSGNAVNHVASSKNQSASFSAKKTQSTAMPAAKKSKETPTRKSKGHKSDRYKVQQALLQSTRGQDLLSKPQTHSKSYFPLSHNAQHPQTEHKSYLIGDNGQPVEKSSSYGIGSDSYGRTSELPADSGFIARIPQSYQKHYHESREIESGGISRGEWEAMETLRNRNQQLSNYVQELEQVEQRMQEEHQRQMKAKVQQFSQQRRKYNDQINYLRAQQARLNNANATLQQLCNQGKQNFDLLNMRFNEATRQSQSGGGVIINSHGQETALRRVRQLQMQLQSSYRKNEEKDRQKKQYQAKLSLVQSEKNDIKLKAEQMLMMLQTIRNTNGL